MTDLGILGGQNSFAHGVNDGETNNEDQVVGHLVTATEPHRAFLRQNDVTTVAGRFRNPASVRSSPPCELSLWLC